MLDADTAEGFSSPAIPPAAARRTHSLERALSILKVFGGDAAALSNSQLVRQTGYSKASVSRITATLVSLGYLARDSRGVRFRVGERGRMLGRTYRVNSPLPLLARPLMQDFADRFDMPVALGIGEGIDMLYLEYCKSPGTATLCMVTGGCIPMEKTAMGRAYLWSQDEPARAALLARLAASGRPELGESMRQAERAFEQLASDGYCVATGEYQDSFGIAVPLRLGHPGLAMSLNCCGILPAPKERQIRELIAPALKELAGRLGQSLAGMDSRLF